MKLTKHPNFEISGVVAKNLPISVSKMNRVLAAGISFDGLWLVLSSSVTTGRFDFSVSLKSRQKQKHPPSIELETQCIDIAPPAPTNIISCYLFIRHIERNRGKNPTFSHIYP